MSEISSIDVLAIQSKLSSVEASTRRIESELAMTNRQLGQVADDLCELSSDLDNLRGAFEMFMQESKKTAALQKAATELIRVRQELERDFGKYKIVRETMLGVLQATDLALVKKTTISQVTEELMLSTPEYWLAPCLVAVAAWIGNDRDLANRAIKESLKRDEEKTALAMALICRRNNRTDTCFEWLSLYFAKQSAAHFTESNFTYLNAYINGVFGPDEKHMCDDYVAKWLREAQNGGEEFEKKQAELWRNYCKSFTVDLEGQFPQMRTNVKEYAQIAEYVNRINSVDRIANKFSGIKNVHVDEENLKKDIDQNLVQLISRCDEKEEPLRREERYLQAVRHFDGDTVAAKQAVLAADRKRTEDTIDLVGQMTNIIINREDAHPSERKTSVNFLSSYIRSGFNQYITETKPDFPKAITMNVDGWVGMSADGSNALALHHSYNDYMEQARQARLSQVNEKKSMVQMIIAGGIAVFGIIMFFVSTFLGILGLAGAAAMLIVGFSTKKKTKQEIEAINQEFNNRIANGHRQIDATLAEWAQARSVVENFENAGIRDIIA